MRLGTHRTDLAVFVNIIFEVIVLGDNSLRDEWLVIDADGWQQGGAVRLSQPRDLCRLLEVLVLQVQASFHGHDLTIGPSEQFKSKRQDTSLLKCNTS